MDAAALVDALQGGTIAGAGFDVTDPEPLPAGHPLWSAPNLIISPHVAGTAGKATFERLADVAAKNVERFLAGQPLAHVVALWASCRSTTQIVCAVRGLPDLTLF